MTMPSPGDEARVAEEWGTWEDAERWSHEAFRTRSPLARLAWLEDLLKLRSAALLATRHVIE